MITTNKTLVANEFQGGILRDLNGDVYPIVSNAAGANGAVTVTAAAAPPNGSMALFRPLGEAAPTPIVDVQTDANLYDIVQPTGVRESNRYADAYLQPDRDTLARFNSTDGQANSFVTGTTQVTPTNPAVLNLANPFRGSSAAGVETDLFWTVYVTTAFETGPDNLGRPTDHDPGNAPNDLPYITAMTDSTVSEVTVVFLETIRDASAPTRTDFNGFDEAVSKARNVAHEVGHQLNVANVAGEHRGGPNDPANNLMYGGGIDHVPDNLFYLVAADVAFLRGQIHSPGSR